MLRALFPHRYQPLEAAEVPAPTNIDLTQVVAFQEPAQAIQPLISARSDTKKVQHITHDVNRAIVAGTHKF